MMGSDWTGHPASNLQSTAGVLSSLAGGWVLVPFPCTLFYPPEVLGTDRYTGQKKKLKKEKSKWENIIFLGTLCWVGEWVLAAGGALLLV